MRLKTTIIRAPILHLDRFGHKFIVTIDASEVSVGAILSRDFNRALLPVCYDMGKINSSKCHENAYKRELLGMVWVVGKWRQYLEGAHFIIQTDHNSEKPPN